MQPANLMLLAGATCLGFVPQRLDNQPRRHTLRCTPAVVRSSGTVELQFEGAHGRELGVRTPDGRFLFIAFEQETPDSVPPVPIARFQTLKTRADAMAYLDQVRLEVDAAKASASSIAAPKP